MQNKTITQTSPTTILALDSHGRQQVWYTRTKYMELLGLSARSIRSPYIHIKNGTAEQFNFFGVSFFRPVV